jgi:hypothetical protein
MITAIYPGGCRKVHMIMKSVAVCPVSDGEFSLDGEFSVYTPGKSP